MTEQKYRARPLCEECNTQVLADATAIWDVDRQEWELCNADFDSAFCETCSMWHKSWGFRDEKEWNGRESF